jgi:hypothetical protein
MSTVIKIRWFEKDTWLSRRGRTWAHQLPTPIRQFFIQRYFLLLVKVLWVSMEVLAIVMAIIGIHEFVDFIDILTGGSYGEESAIWISKWGFGQLVAVCMWFPFILKFISLNIGKSEIFPCHKVTSLTSMNFQMELCRAYGGV